MAALGAARLHADPSLQAMFASHDPAADALGRVLNDFAAVDDLLVAASVPGMGDATPVEIERLTQFGDRLVAEASGSRIGKTDALANLADGAFFKPDADSRKYFDEVLIPAGMYYLDDDAYAAVRARLTRPQMLEQIRYDEARMRAPGAAGTIAKALMQDPLNLREFASSIAAGFEAQRPFHGHQGTDAFLSADGRHLLVFVRGKKSPSDLEFCKKLTATVAATAESVNSDHLDLRYAGSYAIAAASASGVRSDMISSVVGSVLCLQLLFLLAYRDPFKLFALSFGPIALGLLLGFGGYSLVTTGLTPLTAVLGGILAGMAIDYSIQYLSMYESQRDVGATSQLAAERSAIGITPAAFGAWATSIVGFLAIGASSVNALRDFALLGTLGLTGAFLLKMALLPLLLMLTDQRKTGPQFRSRFRFSLVPLLRWIGPRWRWVVCTSIAIFVAALAVLALHPGEILPLESDLTVMHPRPNSALDAQKKIAEWFGTPDWLIVHLRADSQRDLVALAHRVAGKLDGKRARDAGVSGSFGLVSLLPDPTLAARRAESLGPETAQRIVLDFHSVIADSAFDPDAREIRDYEKFLDTALSRRPPGIAALLPYRRLAEMLLPQSAFDGKPVTEAITLVFVSGSIDQRGPRDRAVDGIRAALEGEAGATLTGIGVISHDAEQTVRRDLPRLSILAVAIVLVYLIVHFRNVTEALLSMLPTAFSLVVLLAAMRLAGQKVNMINLVAAPLLIGIDVDYGIFLVALARVKRARKLTRTALVTQIAPVCHAVLICAAATIIGYISLSWTSVPAIRSLGFAVGVGIGACLFSVLFLLAPIFLSLARDSDELPAASEDVRTGKHS